MAGAARGNHARRRHRACTGTRSRDGAAALLAAGRVRTPQRNTGPAQHITESRRRADRQQNGRGLLHVSALRDRCADWRSYARAQTRLAIDKAKGGSGMIRKRGRIHRGAIVLGSAAGSISELALGLWRSEAHKRWLIPLAVFLCVTGLLLIVATTV